MILSKKMSNLLNNFSYKNKNQLIKPIKKNLQKKLLEMKTKNKFSTKILDYSIDNNMLKKFN